MQRQHDRNLTTRRPRRYMNDVAAQQAVIPEFKDMVTGGQLRMNPGP
jgi:hypothetical protein